MGDFAEIVRYGFISTPALVVDDKVVSFGKYLKTQGIINIISKFIKLKISFKINGEKIVAKTRVEAGICGFVTGINTSSGDMQHKTFKVEQTVGLKGNLKNKLYEILKWEITYLTELFI